MYILQGALKYLKEQHEKYGAIVGYVHVCIIIYSVLHVQRHNVGLLVCYDFMLSVQDPLNKGLWDYYFGILMFDHVLYYTDICPLRRGPTLMDKLTSTYTIIRDSMDSIILRIYLQHIEIWLNEFS